MSIVPNDAAAHHHRAVLFDQRDLQAKSLFPRRRRSAELCIDGHCAASMLGRGPNRHVRAERAYPVERILARADEVIAEPILPLARLIDDIEEVGAGRAHLFIP
jgi:hypothetical protein